jgi:hypothetical protein
MKNKYVVVASLIGAVLWTARTQAQDHGHLNVGAAAQTSGAQLRFDNGADFAADYVKTLTFTNAGKYANLFQGNITFTALHSLNAFGEPVPGAPAPGAFILAEIVSVAGPAGGRFQFWETNSVTTPAIGIPTGSANTGFRFELSEAALGAGEPGGDPFGHIHGRRFTVTKPGLYSVGFRAVDVSANGTAGGPIHSVSETLHVYFQGDVNVTKVEPDLDRPHVTFGAMAGYSWQLQSKDTLSDAIWAPAGLPVSGNDKLIEIEDDRPAGLSRVYRLMGTPVSP